MNNINIKDTITVANTVLLVLLCAYKYLLFVDYVPIVEVILLNTAHSLKTRYIVNFVIDMSLQFCTIYVCV